MAMVVLVGLLLQVVLLCLFAIVSYVTISCYWLTPRKIKKFMEKQGVRGPKPRFLVGNLIDVAALVSSASSMDMDSIHHDIVGRLLPHYVNWSKQYGKRFIFWNGSEPRMCLTETDMIKELLSSKYVSLSGKSWLQQQGSKHFIGRGLLMANGDDWYHQRHIVAPAFMADKLKNHVGYMAECTKKMLQSLHTKVESGETEVEIGEYMSQLTGDIISRTEFNSSYEKGKQIFHLLTSLQHLCAQSSRHLCFPGSRFFPSRFNREIKSLKMEVEKLLMEIIQSRKDCVEIGRSTSYGNDLLGMLLAETQKKRASGFNFTLQMLMDECKTFYFTGHETTSLLLTWTTMLLATNPTWQEKVRTEVFQVCGGEAPTAEQLSKLNLLNMVINESLRLYPPASLLPRMAFEDIKLGDLHIPKGLSIWIPVLAIHHSEELWGKDVHEFNPERFAGRPFAPGRHFIPFAAGPRNCVGQSFALMESKTILAMLISRFSFTISKNYRHAPVMVMTLKPKHGVQICLKPLNP
ncbi:PREDICTED: cytokinin hydroxylase-like [Nelumbo nucifera]|uniref:Cytokinin hydroxylase-like n=1 Tax=Nelumbo nucifera TaxID=4432 RepID=A0A1U8AMM2_NELNU|nr:PREDICTED: cytokinin hydroxylase-like [Nelumbo nucifera]